MAVQLATEATQHAAIADKKVTINTIARKLNQTGHGSKTSKYLWMQMATFHDLGGMEIIPNHGASGMYIVRKHTTLL